MNNKFKPGQSGNPKGRPPGSGIAGKLRQAINQKAPELLQVVIDQALNEQDVSAAMALLNKVVPNLKAANESVKFDVDTSGGLSQTGESIIQSIADGSVPLDSGTQILSSLVNLAKLQEIDDIVKRIEALEQKQ